VRAEEAEKEPPKAAMECYRSRWDEPIKKFGDADLQDEFEKVKKAHVFCGVRIDSTTLTVGEGARMLVDARIAGCIQPTRALGDCEESMPLRHPTVLRVIRQNMAKIHNVLLCSDGVFSGGAFGSMDDVCACVLDALQYVKEQFYRNGQELAERLMVSGMMPSCEFKTWRAFLTFLRCRHLPAVRSEEFFSTYQEYHNTHWWKRHNREHTTWLRACHLSVLWLEHNTEDCCPRLRQCGAEMAASIAAHLAVVMGSMDNVSVLVARAV
jgi:hypothetical protein